MDTLAKEGPKEEGKELAVQKFEEACGLRATRCDDRRRADDRVKHGAEKISEMQGKLLREPSEW